MVASSTGSPVGGPSLPPGRVATVPCRVVVLSCPPALCPHLEFALSAELATPVGLRWADQSALPGTLTSSLEASAPPGVGGRLVTRLRILGPVRFEILEGLAGPVVVADPERYSYSPDLGLFRASLAANGDVVVAEGPLRALLAASHQLAAGGATLAPGLERLLGTAWDEELEPLRQGGSGAPVSWLRRTG